MFPLKVSVTPELIAQATTKRDERSEYIVCRDCIIALAIAQAIGKPVTVGYSVWTLRTFTTTEDGLTEISGLRGELPPPAKTAIDLFDRRQDARLEPFEFEINPDFVCVLVSQELIDQAIANRDGGFYNPIRDCLGATALKSVLPDEDITVGVDVALINGRDFQVSNTGIERIRAFIHSEPVLPFYFEVKAIQEGKPCFL